MWINRTSNNFIKSQGILFSNKYHIEFDGTRHLKISKNSNYINIYNEDNRKPLVNVNAIVGKNGAGKTTILKHISDLNILSKLSDTQINGYDEHAKKENEQNTGLQIWEDNERIKISYNFEKEIDIKSDTDYDQEHVVSGVSKINENISKIYITDAKYSPFGNSISTSKGRITSAAITTEILDVIRKMYFDYKIKDGPLIEDSPYNATCIISSLGIDNLRFQDFLDISYYSYLITKGIENSYLGNRIEEIYINVDFLKTRLRRISSNESLNQNHYKTSIDFDKRYKEREGFWSRLFVNLNEDKFDLVVKLKLNMISEIDYITEFLDDKNLNLVNIDEMVKMAIESIEIEKNKEYYLTAYKDIDSFEKIISNAIPSTNNLSESDFAYTKNYKINDNKDKENFRQMVILINELFEKKSFIMKYLHIEGKGISSGERVILNFFSWLNMLTKFEKLGFENVVGLNKDILILIDELDINLHPEWQQQILGFFIDEINRQFQNHNIQLIFTTHSPIMLSDIPSSNIVYVKKNDSNEPLIFNKFYDQTFASNIYQLFNNSFFMMHKGAIGSVSLQYINDLIEYINNGKKNSIENNITRKLDIIGDPIIKNKLYSMAEITKTKENRYEKAKLKKNEIKRKLEEIQILLENEE
jgi:predicted ATPase